MLVLSRFKDEIICIGEEIEIVIIDVRSDGKVRVGIEAPKNIQVHRKEIKERIDREKEVNKIK